MTLQTYSRPSSSFVFPWWARTFMASLMMLVAGLGVAKHFSRYEWVGWLSFGLYYVVYPTKSAEESTRQYLRKPRTIIAGVLIFVTMAGFLRTLYLLSSN